MIAPDTVLSNKSTTTDSLVRLVHTARASGDPQVGALHPRAPRQTTRNQFCLFLKPGAVEPGVDLAAVLELVLETTSSFNVEVEAVRVIPGNVLADRQVMEQHYSGLFNQAVSGVSALSNRSRGRFRSIYDLEVDDAPVLGAYQLLSLRCNVSALQLNDIWSEASQCRLGPATFCAQIPISGRTYYVINGFVPHLLERYRRPDSAIVVFCVSGDISWADARQKMLGAPDPVAACPGSLRHRFLLNQTALKLRGLGLGWNGAHLSAGPLEALAELLRFDAVSSGHPSQLQTYQFGRRLLLAFEPKEVNCMLTAIHSASGELPPLAELTEELDEETAVMELARLNPARA